MVEDPSERAELRDGQTASEGRTPPVYAAIVDSAYFIGAVALVNSLRLTGHQGEIAFLDVGLEPAQRVFLEQEARVHDGTRASGWVSVFVKPTLGLLEPDRTVVLLDNDLVVTGSLEPLVEAAEDGAIAVFEDTDPTRWFDEWQSLFSLRRPLRHGAYANGSCVALCTRRWSTFLNRWLELGESVSAARSRRPFLLRQSEVEDDPIGFNEQDTLNALLLSEVPPEAVRSWPHTLTPNWDERRAVRVLDARTLRCEAHGTPPLFLHFTGQPKPWHPNGWLRQRYPAFNSLLTRVLVGDDVPLRLTRSQLPRWLQPGPGGRCLELSLAGVARVAYGVLAVVPDGFRTRLTASMRARLSGTGGRAR